MRHFAYILAAMSFIGGSISAQAQDKTPQKSKKLPDGVYAVLRESLKEQDVLPLKEGEVLVVNRFRYLKTDDKQPPRYLVVRSAPDVHLDLAAAPKADKEGEETVRILLKLRPKAAAALERLTSGQVGRPVAILVDGDVVTTHKIREAIKGGEVQITSCAAGAANYLLKQLQAHEKKDR